ncbi:MAG: hypothetical protein M3447_07655 [Acidobacteriota bacterium]|nr:hypothetical protein [Acidobacteriota bacterium]
MKSTFLKAVKVVALSLVLSLGASGVVFANGAGSSPAKVAYNGAGNGAGSSKTWSKKKKARRQVAKKIAKKRVKTAQHSTH